MRPALGADALRWKFIPGETLKYTMVQQTSQGMKAQGQEFKTALNQTVDLHWDVKGVTNGVADMTQTIDRVRTKIEGPGQVLRVRLEREKAPEGPIATPLTPCSRPWWGPNSPSRWTGGVSSPTSRSPRSCSTRSARRGRRPRPAACSRKRA